MRKRLTAAAFAALFFLFGLAPGARALDLRGDAEFYLKQETGVTCTLSAAAMMLRRRACLDGLKQWPAITESSLRRVAWSYVGLSHDFAMQGMTVLHGRFGSGDSVESQLLSLLRTHPEGVVVYDRTVPHAILVTDHTDGVFYCADPSGAAADGRIPVEQSTISLARARSYWYIAADANGAAEGAALRVQDAAYPARLAAGSGFALAGRLSTAGTLRRVSVALLGDGGKAVQSAAEEPQTAGYDLARLVGGLDFAALPPGSYTYALSADDDRGGHLRVKKAFVVADGETVPAAYSGSVPVLSAVNAAELTPAGFTVEAGAADPDGPALTLLFSTWADGVPFEQGVLGRRSGGAFAAHIRADIPALGVRSFLVNVTAADADGNYTGAALLVRVSAGDPDAGDAGLTADQLLL